MKVKKLGRLSVVDIYKIRNVIFFEGINIIYFWVCRKGDRGRYYKYDYCPHSTFGEFMYVDYLYSVVRITETWNTSNILKIARYIFRKQRW